MRKILFCFTIIILFFQMSNARQVGVPAGLPTQADSAKWFLYSEDMQTILDSTAGVARTNVSNYDTVLTCNNDSAYNAILEIWYPGGTSGRVEIQINTLYIPSQTIDDLFNRVPTDTMTGSLLAQMLRDISLSADTSLWANIPEFLDSMNARGVSLFSEPFWAQISIRADSGNAGSTTITDADMSSIIDTLFNRLVSDTVNGSLLAQLIRDAASSGGVTDTSMIKLMITNNPALVMANVSTLALQATLIQVQDSVNKILDSIYISTAQQIYSFFISGTNEDVFKASGFSTFNPATDPVNQVTTLINPVSLLTNDMRVLAGIVADSVLADSVAYRAFGFATADGLDTLFIYHGLKLGGKYVNTFSDPLDAWFIISPTGDTLWQFDYRHPSGVAGNAPDSVIIIKGL